MNEIFRQLKFLAPFLIVGLVTAASDDRDIKPSIVNGSPASDSAYPWMVALVRANESNNADAQFCGGVLIHPLWVLTAAHCVNDYQNDGFEILVGATDLRFGGQRHQPAIVFLHPETDIKRIDRGSDLALIRLSEPIEDVTPIPLYRAVNALAPGTNVRSIGWGATEFDSDEDTSSDVLREVDLVIQAITDLPENDPTKDYFIMTDDTAPIRGTASGDSGGPLIVNTPEQGWSVAGVVSFGVRTSDGQFNNSFYSSIAAGIDWIDSLVFDDKWNRKEISAFDRIGFARNATGKLLPAYQFWPYGDGFVEQMLPFELSNSQFNIEFDLDNPNFKYNGDGSFSFLHEPNFNGTDRAGETASIVTLKGSNETSSGNHPFALQPFGRTVARQGLDHFLTYHKDGYVFQLSHLEPNKSYQISAPSSPSEYRLLELSSEARTVLALSQRFQELDATFTAKPGCEYWFSTASDGLRGHQTRFGLHPASNASLTDDSPYSGTLSEDSAVYRGVSTRAEQVSYTGSAQNEAVLQVYSDYDTEIALFRKDDNALIGYYDVESEEATEAFIVSADDLRESLITLLNFDKDIYGDFRLSLIPFTRPNLTYGTELKSAITRHDRSYVDSDGEVYYEQFDITRRSNRNYIKIELVGRYFDPGVAVFDGNDLVDFQYGSRFIEFEFRSSQASQYTIEVYDFEGPQNANYELTVTDSTTATLTDDQNPETTPLSLKGKPGIFPIRTGKLSQKEAERRIKNIIRLRGN